MRAAISDALRSLQSAKLLLQIVARDLKHYPEDTPEKEAWQEVANLTIKLDNAIRKARRLHNESLNSMDR